LHSHTPLMGNECERQLFELNPTLDLYPILEPKLDLNQFHESILVSESFTLESKSTVLPNHIPLLDQGVEQYNSEMVYQDWSYNWDDFHVRILHDSIHLGDNSNVNGLEVKS